MRMQTPGKTSGDRNREVRIWKDQKRPASKRRDNRNGSRSGERGAFRGTRASANTSGPDSNRALGPVKLRSKDSAPNEENPFLLPDRFWESELARKSIQPFDLMSRRHPLSSTRAFRFQIRFEKQTVLR